MQKNKRAASRVQFEQGLEVTVFAIDGTWSVKGRLSDISKTGAKFRALTEVNKRIQSEEFFLALTPDKKVHRRAKFVWERKGHIGLKFIARSGL